MDAPQLRFVWCWVLSWPYLALPGPAAGSANCQDCAAGKYSGATGSISAANCQDCAAGKYSDATGSTSAANCQDQSADVVAAAEAATSDVVIAVDGSSNGGT